MCIIYHIESIELNGYIIEVLEIHQELPLVKKSASNSTLRRFIEQGTIRFNGKVVKPNDKLDFPILSVVMFPKSDKQYTTLY